MTLPPGDVQRHRDGGRLREDARPGGVTRSTAQREESLRTDAGEILSRDYQVAHTTGEMLSCN